MRHIARHGKFPLGAVVSTPGAFGALIASGELPLVFLARHVLGDWGELDEDDWKANDEALRVGSRIFSSYLTQTGTKIWVITEADRSSTTLLLPEEY